MESKFTIINVLRTSWSTLVSQIWILAGLLIGYVLLSFIIGAVSPALSSFWPGVFILNILSVIISLIFSLGYLKNLFQALDGDEPRFSAYGQQAHKILTYFVSGLLMGVLIFIVLGIFLLPYFYLLYNFSFVREMIDGFNAIFAGSNYLPELPEGSVLTFIILALGGLCLSLPAVYISIRFMFYQAFIVEDNAGIIESLEKSWKITQGHTLRLFLLGLVMLGLIIAGLLVFIVGIFVAIPLTQLMYCSVFRKLNVYSTSLPDSAD
ncbi:MAG: DUF975 family protein [Tannerellaceae bacterium]|jgi:hypothetical protein|nr:DUF975 family protein [Tannerellaceae bacterium]